MFEKFLCKWRTKLPRANSGFQLGRSFLGKKSLCFKLCVGTSTLCINPLINMPKASMQEETKHIAAMTLFQTANVVKASLIYDFREYWVILFLECFKPYSVPTSLLIT